MMKRLLLIWLGLGLLESAMAQGEFKLRRVHVYRDGAAMLEYSGFMATRQARFMMDLPAIARPEGIQVRIDDREKLVNYLVHEVETEASQIYGEMVDLLRANVGQNLTVESFEGSESVGYSGELLPMHPEAEVVLLRTPNAIETIPIKTITHVTGGRSLHTTKVVKRKSLALSVYLVSDFNELPLTVLVPANGFASEARYLLDFDKEKPEMSLDLSLFSPLTLDEVDILYYNHAFFEREVSSFTSQAAFRLAGAKMQAATRTHYQVLASEVPLALTDEVVVPAWEPGDQALTSKTTGKRYLSLTNNSQMDWFASGIYERKGLSLGRIPGVLPEIPKKATARMEYGPSPYVLTDNARLVKIKKKAIDLNGMKYDSYLYIGRIEIRNTSREAGRVRIIKHCVPDARRNYWFANQFFDLKDKTKQEVTQLEYEVKVEANDVAFYSYRYELLLPSED